MIPQKGKNLRILKNLDAGIAAVSPLVKLYIGFVIYIL